MTAVTHLLGRKLPCGHAFIRSTARGTIRRVCRSCKRVYVGHVEPSAVSEQTGVEVARVRWEVVEK